MDVKVTDVCLSLGGSRIVLDASLTARSGEIVGVLGPNGSGKSTLLRSVYRSLRPESGRVVVGDADVWRELSPRAAARRTAALTQHGLTEMTTTVVEVVALGCVAHAHNGFGQSTRDRRAALDALSQVGMESAADRPITELSGGEQQRVHLARALCQQAEVLVLDEPTNHLDVAHQFGLLDLVVSSGLTVIVVLHDLNLAARYCDSVYLLRSGRVVTSGATRDVLTPEWIAEVFGVRAQLVDDTADGRPAVLLSPFDKGEDDAQAPKVASIASRFDTIGDSINGGRVR